MAVNFENDHNYHSSTTDPGRCAESPNLKNHQNRHDFETENENSVNEWQTVTSRNVKRNQVSSPGNEQKRHRTGSSTTTNIRLSNEIQLKNNYAPLASIQENAMDDETSTPNTAKDSKPPPIFLPGVTNVTPMIKSLDSMVTKTGYSYKCLNQDKIKIFPTSPEDYRKIVRGLTELNICFHTYQLKQERAYKVVLKNMHYSTPIEDLKAAIEENGHKVRNLTNVKNKFTKAPMSLFFIDLEPNSNNKEIFQIQYLLNAKILFEPPQKKKEVVQCKRCQRYGHTKAYCHNVFRCVKCTLEHDTKVCPKPPTAPPTCVLCSGGHPANYKGCPVYREIQNKQFPPLRKKHLEPNQVSNKLQSPSEEKPKHIRSVVTDGVTFAQATSNSNQGVHTREHKPNEQICDSDNFTEIIQKSFERFENILSKQAEQISTLLNLLTTIVSRLK